jgi:hypothetical protein
MIGLQEHFNGKGLLLIFSNSGILYLFRKDFFKALEDFIITLAKIEYLKIELLMNLLREANDLSVDRVGLVFDSVLTDVLDIF